jgi:hypothetical protein
MMSAADGTAVGRPDRRHVRASPRQPMAQLRVLGGFELTVCGIPVDQFAGRPRARKALHVLALYVGRPVHRGLLAQAVWPASRPRTLSADNTARYLRSSELSAEVGMPSRQ